VGPQQLDAGGVGKHAEDLDDQIRVIVGQRAYMPICIHTQIVAVGGWNSNRGRRVAGDMTERTVVIYANPRGPQSRANAALLRAMAGRPGTEIRDLAELYPDGVIDIRTEQESLERGLMKTWLDEVMTPGWAYGPGRPGALAGKTLRVATTTGGTTEGYQPGGLHGFQYAQLLAPLQATARRLGMEFVDPFVLHGVRDLSDAELAEAAERYAQPEVVAVAS
jgi:putative NADPH-quinone reductase